MLHIVVACQAAIARDHLLLIMDKGRALVNGKGGKDRYVELSQVLLETLRAYWLKHGRPKTWLLPSPSRDAHIDQSLVQRRTVWFNHSFLFGANDWPLVRELASGTSRP